MTLHVLTSGSIGNCYLFIGETETLIWDAGIGVIEVKKALDFNLSSIVGCICDHVHGDHFGKAKEFLKNGIDIYASKETIASSGISHHRIHPITEMVAFKIGGFTIMPFPLKHDVHCFGFSINHKECGNTIAITDTYYVPYKFKGINNLLIESNYDIDIANRAIENGASPAVRNRVIESHLSIATTVKFLQANDLSAVNNIVLLHLSNGNSNAREFQERVQAVAPGKKVTIADKNVSINLNLIPF